MVESMIMGFGIGMVFGVYVYKMFAPQIDAIFNTFKKNPNSPMQKKIDNLNRTADNVNRTLGSVEKQISDVVDRAMNGEQKPEEKKYGVAM